MKLFRLAIALVFASTAFAQTMVTINNQTKQLQPTVPNIVVGNGQSITATGTGVIGATSFSGTINLATQVTGNLNVSHLGGGTGASAATFWRGDGAWVAVDALPSMTGNQNKLLTTDGSNASWTATPFITSLTISQSALASTPADAVLIQNTTTATALVPVQISPRKRYLSSGWKTDATAAAQAIEWTEELIPMQGASRPGGGLRWKAFINGGSAIQMGRVDLRHATLATNIDGWGSTFLGYRAGDANFTSGTGGYNNTFIGGSAGTANDTGYANTFVGTHAGKVNTSGFYNIFVGDGAGESITTTSQNVMVGVHAGDTLVSAADSVIIGNGAGIGAGGSPSASFNVFVGAGSGAGITSATNTTAIGRNAGQTLTSGAGNVAAGDYSGYGLTTGSDNVLIGNLVGYTATPANALVSGSNNVYVGREAGASVASGTLSNTIAIGYRALVGASNTATYGNSSITAATLYGALTLPQLNLVATPADGLVISNTTAATVGVPVQISPRTRQRATGWKTDATAASQTLDWTEELIPMQGASRVGGGIEWKAFIDGGAAIRMGYVNLRHNTNTTNIAGWGSTFIGYRAGDANFTSGTDGYSNTFIGSATGVANDTGYANTFVGSHAGMSNTSGFYNVAVGDGALLTSTTSSQNVMIGTHAAQNLTAPSDSVHVGYGAGAGATPFTASSNVFIGAGAATGVTSGTENAAVGRNTIFSLTSGTRNAAIGDQAGYGVTSGTDNVSIGYLTSYTDVGANALTTGIQNTHVGTQAGPSTSSQLSNTIAIGYRAKVGASNTATYGNSSITASTIYGAVSLPSTLTVGVTATSAAAPTIASATTIAPTTRILFVSGVTTIETITAPSPISAGGGSIVIIPTGVFLTGVTGNIALASTSVVSRALTMTYDVTTTKWYPSY